MSAEIMAKYGIEPKLDTDTLVELRKAYEAVVSSAKESISASDDLVSEKVKAYSKDEGLVALQDSLKNVLLEVLYDYSDTDERISVGMYEVMKELTSLFKYERDCFLRTEKQKINPSAKVDDDFKEKCDEAEALGKAIRTLFESMFTMFPDMFKNPIEGFPLKDSKTKGKLPDLSKAPYTKGDDEGTTIVGRKVTGSHLELFFNDEKVFPDAGFLTPYEVARKVLSSRETGYWVTWKAVLDMVKDAGKNIMTDSWKINLPTGSLEGKVAGKTE